MARCQQVISHVLTFYFSLFFRFLYLKPYSLCFHLFSIFLLLPSRSRHSFVPPFFSHCQPKASTMHSCSAMTPFTPACSLSNLWLTVSSSLLQTCCCCRRHQALCGWQYQVDAKLMFFLFLLTPSMINLSCEILFYQNLWFWLSVTLFPHQYLIVIRKDGQWIGVEKKILKVTLFLYQCSAPFPI